MGGRKKVAWLKKKGGDVKKSQEVPLPATGREFTGKTEDSRPGRRGKSISTAEGKSGKKIIAFSKREHESGENRGEKTWEMIEMDSKRYSGGGRGGGGGKGEGIKGIKPLHMEQNKEESSLN